VKSPNEGERLIHQLKTANISTILSEGAWQTYSQSITSAATNNDVSATPDENKMANGDTSCGVEAFADLNFGDEVKTILDVGGGKYNVSVDFMRDRNVELLIWDPYNRSKHHNQQIEESINSKKVLAATSMSILNVIPEPEVRLAHITTLKHALLLNGKAYFKVWPGEGEKKSTYQPAINAYGSDGYQANAGPDRFLREIQLVFGLENADIHPSIPNLIIATNRSETVTTTSEIEKIQALSVNDEWLTTLIAASKTTPSLNRLK
tara:strand:+ start:712 stop:1503 length:792 start_codon:yes stop_codon:yes gene_type:complete